MQNYVQFEKNLPGYIIIYKSASLWQRESQDISSSYLSTQVGNSLDSGGRSFEAS